MDITRRYKDYNKVEVLHIRITSKYKKELKDLADEYGISVSLLIREAIYKFLVNENVA